MGWEALGQWGDDVARIEPLAGGVANDVWTVRVNGHLAVGRLGARSDADLAWETELLQHLDREGLTVPVPIPTTDGRLFADGLVVMTYVEGGPPETEADWRRVADTLRQLHRLTQGWPQRPGWRSSTDLLHAETGTKIDLGAMPPEGVARCRAAWARLTGRGAPGRRPRAVLIESTSRWASLGEPSTLDGCRATSGERRREALAGTACLTSTVDRTVRAGVTGYECGRGSASSVPGRTGRFSRTRMASVYPSTERAAAPFSRRRDQCCRR